MKLAGRMVLGLSLIFLLGGLVVARASFSTSPEAPPRDPPRKLGDHREFPAGISWDPPSRDFQPRISGEDAYEIAWTEEGAPGEAHRAQALLILLTHPGLGMQRAPIWIVKYTGDICVPLYGPAGRAGPACTETAEWHVVVDATTGKAIMAYK